MLLILGNADPRILHGKGDTGPRLSGHREAHLALLGELDRIGQQVLENLLDPLAVGEQHLRRSRLQLHLEFQALVLGQRLEQAAQPVHQARHAGVLRAHFELAGLDLGDVEDVVDQVQQVIARGIDRLGELDLLGAEVFLGVFRQQLGQDQRTVERRAQLVGHVGKELGLVLAGALQLFGALLELGLGLVELVVLAVHGVALIGQDLRLLRQLLVGLLQLHLLGFQVHLGFLEDPRLLFQLLVGGLELFLLHLQLFVELLGFGQHFLQALAITRGLDGGADIAGNQFQQLDVALAQGPQEAQLDHPVDPVVVTGRHHQHAARRTIAQAGADLEVIGGHLVQTDQALVLRGLPHQPFVTVQRLFLGFLFPGEAIGRHAPEAPVLLAHIERRHRCAQVLGAELQDVAPQQVQAQLAEHLLGQFGLAVAQPGLLFQAPGALFLGFEVVAVALGQCQQVTTADVGQQRADAHHEQQVQHHAENGGARNVLVTLQAQLLLHGHRVVVFLADLVSQALATPGLHRPAVITALAAQVDHALGKVVPLHLQGFQALEPVHLLRVVRHQLLQAAQFADDARLGHFVGVQKVLVASDQEAAHAGFQVDGQARRLVEVVDHSISVLHPLDDREQVGDQGHEKNRAEYTDTQRQADVAGQQLAETLFINRGRTNHLMGLGAGEKKRSLPHIQPGQLFFITKVALACDLSCRGTKEAVILADACTRGIFCTASGTCGKPALTDAQGCLPHCPAEFIS